MKYELIKAIIFFAVLLDVVSCARPKLDGVQVGNGMKSYVSQYGYTLIYPASLDLKESEKGLTVTIDNAKSTSSDVSRLEARLITGVAVANLDALGLFARGDSRREVSEVKNAGVPAVEARSGGGKTLSLFRYLLMPGGKVLKLALQASAVANGVALFAPVVEGVRVDTTPPKVLSLKWENDRLEAGKTATLLLEVEEEGSGVDKVNCGLIPIDDKGRSIGKLIRVAGALKATADKGAFVYELTLSPWMKAGLYTVEIILSDRAGNGTIFGANFSEFLSVKGREPLLWKIDLVNAGREDQVGPAIKTVELPEEIVPGKGWEIRVQATDDVSGVATGQTRVGLFSPVCELGYVFFEVDKAGSGYGRKYCPAEIVREGTSDRYWLRFAPSHYLAPGPLFLHSVEMSDRARNLTIQLSKGKTSVKHVGEFRLPKITAIPLSAKVEAGGEMTFEVHLEAPLRENEFTFNLALQSAKDGRIDLSSNYIHLRGGAENTKDKKVILLRVRTDQGTPAGHYAVSSFYSDDIPGFGVFSDALDLKLQIPTTMIEFL